MYRKYLETYQNPSISMDDIEENVLDAISSLKEDATPSFDGDTNLTSEDIQLLLSQSEVDDDFKPRKDGIGYPSGPFHMQIANCLYDWLNSGNTEWLRFRKYNLLDEADYPEQRKEKFDDLNQSVSGASSLWSHWNKEEKSFFIKNIISSLGKRGFLDMLGLRKTCGSHLVLPPSRSTLIKAFEEQPIERSNLSVGARALAKHHHRDSSASFWGVSTGTEAAKNEHARKIVDKILDGAAWINIHELPGQLPILEVRSHEGYGARWSHDGSSFRGFLEPQVEEGWLNKYRH